MCLVRVKNFSDVRIQVSVRSHDTNRTAAFIASTCGGIVRKNLVTVTLVSSAPPKKKIVPPLPKIGLRVNGLDDTWCHATPANSEERYTKEQSEKLRRQLKLERRIANAKRT